MLHQVQAPTIPSMVLAERKGETGLITLNRPDAMNALCSKLIDELNDAVASFEQDDEIGCIVITGSPKVFAAGADLKEMHPLTFGDVYNANYLSNWDRVTQCRKPVIAAVSGFALGGGCELAMSCDIVIASETAKFGQPEVRVGITPGAGGTQRLTRAIGKAKAMDLCLTGRLMDAAEAERSGLVSRIVPADELIPKALEMAEQIAAFSQPVTMMIKECVNRSFETTLSEGCLYERRQFHAAFAMSDRAEGMAAFLEKRKPRFRNR